MRDLFLTIERMKIHIPETECDLVLALDKILSDANFTAPEVMWTRWAEVQAILEEKIGKPTAPWHVTVGLIWSGQGGD